MSTWERRDDYHPGGRLGGFHLEGPRWRHDGRDGSVIVVARRAPRTGGGWLRLSWAPTRFNWFGPPGEPLELVDGQWRVRAFPTRRLAIEGR